MTLTAIVLTHNEARHIERCLRSIDEIADTVVVVDSGSTDGTVALAARLGARVLRRPWRNYADQFNWALAELHPSTDWVLRIDADEVLTPELRQSITALLPTLGPDVAGIVVRRRIVFQGRPIRFGGVGAVRQLRLFRHGRGRCEQRWMDEHIVALGRTVEARGYLIDDNLNTLTWWTEKHNRYASREAIDLLNLKYRFLPEDRAGSGPRSGAGLKRRLKEGVYAKLPGGVRAFGYFAYRYVARLGFLDGRTGTAFHVLQAFWYRYLVDQKVAEVKRYMARTGAAAPEAIKAVLDIDIC